jgi:hypothetical protein
MPFFAELPDEPGGMPPHLYWVAEGNIVRRGDLPDAHLASDPERKMLVFIGPPELVARHSRVYLDGHPGWVEVDGPARKLGDDGSEWAALVRGKARLA